MIRDLDQSSDERLEYDVCIVGSGPAGMTVANELNGSGLRVVVLESGRLKPTRYGDALRTVSSEGIQIKDYSRERVLGGASSTWSGLSSPLDPIDFETRSFMTQSGWPLTRDELMPFYAEAAERYRFAGLELFGAPGFGALKQQGDRELSWGALDEKIFLKAGESPNFGQEYKHVFETKQFDLYLDATLIELRRANGDSRRVTHGVARTRGGRRVEIAARFFVLATGGIENARILLASCDVDPRGLGNEHDQVGRYLMNHPKNYYGLIHLSEPVKELPYLFGCLYRGYAGYAGLRLSESLQRERECLNSYVRFEPLFPWSDNRGVEALVFLVKRTYLFGRWQAKRAGKIVSLRDYSETGDESDLQNKRKSWLDWLGFFVLIATNLVPVTRYVVSRIREGSAPSIHVVRLRNFMEMEPVPENRVVLGEERDAGGQPLPVVRHETTELDRRSLLALHDVLAEELERNQFGRLDSQLASAEPWPIDLDASHHMGTTRMGTAPETSVVTPDCHLHSVENVYLAGSSVFPTSGCANPTFTLVALAIRLGKHLRKRVLPGDAVAVEDATT